MSTDNFISAIKAKRDEAIEHFLSEEFIKGLYIGEDGPAVVVQAGVDKLVGSILDVVEEQYGDIITAATEEGEDVTVSCASDLSTLYFEEVSN